MNDRLCDTTLTSTQPAWTPKQRIPSAEFFTLSDDEIRTLFPGVDDFAAGLMNDGAATGQKQESA